MEKPFNAKAQRGKDAKVLKGFVLALGRHFSVSTCDHPPC
jgi:hypothetical protein